jgi:heme/copper-type cytochrome/quinol oxidase subunit 2
MRKLIVFLGVIVALLALLIAYSAKGQAKPRPTHIKMNTGITALDFRNQKNFGDCVMV